MTSARLKYQQGDHICAIYSTRDEQLAAAIRYISDGLARGEQCLYVCGEHSIDEFREGLRAGGIDVEYEEGRNALLLLTKHEAHLQGGSFDPDKMITMLHGAVKNALDAGFAGLCAAGDMSWLLDEADGSHRIAEYEAKLNHFYPSSKALGLCLYNRNRLPAAALDHSIATHPHVRIDSNILLENPFYEEPAKAAARTSDGGLLHKKLESLKALLANVLSGGSAARQPATS